MSLLFYLAFLLAGNPNPSVPPAWALVGYPDDFTFTKREILEWKLERKYQLNSNCLLFEQCAPRAQKGI